MYFSLEELTYEYPEEALIDGMDAQQSLEHCVRECIPDRYPEGLPQSVLRAVRHELDLIKEMGYAPYFLTVYSIVRFARSRGILCQGRGSAANSAICYILGVTSIDPETNDLLFERFVSKERNEPPDIDVDFEHERREEVIQWIYKTYGRDRAALFVRSRVIEPRVRSATSASYGFTGGRDQSPLVGAVVVVGGGDGAQCARAESQSRRLPSCDDASSCSRSHGCSSTSRPACRWLRADAFTPR